MAPSEFIVVVESDEDAGSCVDVVDGLWLSLVVPDSEADDADELCDSDEDVGICKLVDDGTVELKVNEDDGTRPPDVVVPPWLDVAALKLENEDTDVLCKTVLLPGLVSEAGPEVSPPERCRDEEEEAIDEDRD